VGAWALLHDCLYYSRDTSYHFDERFAGGKALYDFREERCELLSQHGVRRIAESNPYDRRRTFAEGGKGCEVLILRHDDVFVPVGKFKNSPIIECQAWLIVDVNRLM